MNLKGEVRYNYRRKKEGVIWPERMKYRRKEKENEVPENRERE